VESCLQLSSHIIVLWLFSHSHFIHVLELEVDKGLYGTALNLYDDVDNGHKEQGTHGHIAAAQASDDAFLPAIGYVMGYETEEHQGQYVLIALKNGHEEVGTEVVKDAVEHHQAGVERQVAEEKPRETHEMEGDENGQRTANATAYIASRVF